MIIAAAISFTICTSMLLYMLLRERGIRRSAQAHALQLAQIGESHRIRLAVLFDVLDRCAGGLKKRITEHAEIEGALRKAPEIFIAEPALRHWLNANDQFYQALLSASGGTKTASVSIFSEADSEATLEGKT